MRGEGPLIAHRNGQKEQLLSRLDEVIEGTVVENYRRCGKPECHCATVQVHGPYYLLFWSEDGRTCTQHIPRDRVGQVKAMTEHYRRAREALRKIGRYNRRLVLGGTAEVLGHSDRRQTFWDATSCARLVPQDHRLLEIDLVVDFGFVEQQRACPEIRRKSSGGSRSPCGATGARTNPIDGRSRRCQHTMW